MTMEGLRSPFPNFWEGLAGALGLGKPNGKTFVEEMGRITLAKSMDEFDQDDHFLNTILACPPDKCQQLRIRLREIDLAAETLVSYPYQEY